MLHMVDFLPTTPPRLIFIFLALSLLFIQTIQVSVKPLSYYDYQPLFMEGSRKAIIRGVTTDKDVSDIFNSTFTITLQRLQNTAPTPYLVAVGFKILQIDISSSSIYVNYHIYETSRTATNFVIGAYCSSQSFLTRYQVAYLAISKKIGDVYYFNQFKTVNQVLAWPNYIDYSFVDTSIQASGAPYYILVSISKFSVKQYPLHTYQGIIVQVTAKSITQYNMRFYSHGLQVQNFRAQGFIISNSLLNNLKKQHVLYVSYYFHQSPTGYYAGSILTLQSVQLSVDNVFFGINYFRTNSLNIGIQLNVTQSAVKLYKQATVPYMAAYILVYFRNMCPDPYFYNQTSQQCRSCAQNCLDCNEKQCLECKDNFTLTNDKLNCQCLIQLVSGICYDFDSSNMKGCLSAQVSSNIITCLMCSISQNLILSNNECICKSGYEFNSNRKCIETCGDGRLFYLACDDGNLINGDGCSDKCTVEMGFVCSLQGSSKCRYDMTVEYGLMSIMKNKNNSAIMKLKPRRNLRFPVSYDDLVDSTGNQRLNMTIRINDTDVLLSPTLMSVQDNEITLLIEYDMTIECQVTTIDIDLTETIYTSEKSQVKFDACGDNEPLIISQYSEMFLKTEYVYIGVGLIVLLLLGVGLCTPKYIGVEAILTLQLIYYSCLLVTDVEKYPVGFRTFVTFKYSTGFNDLFDYTRILLNEDFSKKIYWMTLHKTLIENYNLSFIILFLASIFLICTTIYRSKTQENFQERSSKNTIQQVQIFTHKMKLSLKLNTSVYNFMSHIMIWSILQIMAALLLQIQISNKSIEIASLGIFLNFRGLIGIISIFLVGMIGANNYKNILLSQLTWGLMLSKPHQIQYRKANFIYLITMGFMIFIMNQTVIFKLIPTSLFVLLIHVSYIISLKNIGPYQQSLNIHKYGLFFCQFVYLFFLIVINIINFFGIKNQIISLVIVYLTLTACAIIIIFTIVRLYYEYRYGAELQSKIQKERQLERQFNLKNQQFELKRKMKSFESKFKQNLNQYQLSRLQNKFLFENQLQEELMNQEISFLNDRPNLSDQKKEVYYFQKFHTKPLNWLKTNDVEEYQKRINEMEAKKAQQNEKKRQKMQSIEYIELTTRLRKQFLELSRQENSQQSQLSSTQ